MNDQSSEIDRFMDEKGKRILFEKSMKATRHKRKTWKNLLNEIIVTDMNNKRNDIL